jgi:cell wall-associated NlpC family hydrolase
VLPRGIWPAGTGPGGRRRACAPQDPPCQAVRQRQQAAAPPVAPGPPSPAQSTAGCGGRAARRIAAGLAGSGAWPGAGLAGSTAEQEERVAQVNPHLLAMPARWRHTVVIITMLVTAGVLATAMGAAGAQPQPTIGQVRQKLAKLTSQEDQVIQHYDQVSQQLAAARTQLALVNREVARDRAQFAAMRGQIAQIAAFAYENGTMSSPVTMLTVGNPASVLSQASMLTQLATSRHQQLQQFITAARQLSLAQQRARRTESAVAAIRAKLARQRASLGKVIARQKAILASLTAQQQAAMTVGYGGITSAVYTGTTSTQAGKAVAFAFRVMNAHTPYVYGGTGPPGPNGGYDCSGLVQAAWAAAGVSIPRDSYSQWAALPHVPMSNIRPGDLIFFDGEGHVAIYVGNNMIIDAPQPGGYVEEVSLSSSWYASTLDGAARP